MRSLLCSRRNTRSYCNGQGRTTPTLCAAGSYAPSSGYGASCLECPVGTFTSVQGATQCCPCCAGWYARSSQSAQLSVAHTHAQVQWTDWTDALHELPQRRHLWAGLFTPWVVQQVLVLTTPGRGWNMLAVLCRCLPCVVLLLPCEPCMLMYGQRVVEFSARPRAHTIASVLAYIVVGAGPRARRRADARHSSASTFRATSRHVAAVLALAAQTAAPSHMSTRCAACRASATLVSTRPTAILGAAR
jgi:hypothetical protein